MSTKKKSNDCQMLSEFIKDINPKWSMKDWFDWPPDAFALTSILLGDSGTHRYTVSPPFNEIDWPPADWADDLRSKAKHWQSYLATGQDKPHKSLRQLFKKIRSLAKSITTHDFYSGSRIEHQKHIKSLYKSLIELHALADNVCEGFGVHRTWLRQQELMNLHLVSNFMLTTRGTLSRLPIEKGIVLPKSRTPQVGLTLRSLSHHLTFHRTEVDIVWRAAPWLNRDEDIVNILIVPWPEKVDGNYFKPLLHPGSTQRLGQARYFSYSDDSEKSDFDPSAIISMIQHALVNVSRVHMLVLPETALNREKLRTLQAALVNHFKTRRDLIPIIITGITDRWKREDFAKYTSKDFSSSPKIGAFHSNRVSLSVFYSEKWYELSQDKHHRWKLDSSQIQQYQLGGVLTGSRVWWEAINIPKRRLSFLAPNSWLTLCPLICEDLARLEPVSELIRGVGPTLLVALLLDGPQLRERWPGRYASVFADDPGSSVLTVTSLGFCKRSRPQKGSEDRSRTIALWKDQINGWREIELDAESSGVVLSVSATWRQEVTSDGRDDKHNAAILALQNTFNVSSNHGNITATQELEEQQYSSEHDLIELTLWTYFVNAILDEAPTGDLLNTFDSWIKGEETDNIIRHKNLSFLVPLIQRGLNDYNRDYLEIPIEDCHEHANQTVSSKERDRSTTSQGTKREQIPSPELLHAVQSLLREVKRSDAPPKERIRKPRKNDHLESDPDRRKRSLKRWNQLVEQAAKRLKEIELSISLDRVKDILPKEFNREIDDLVRIELSVPPSILWAVHHRLANHRREGILTMEGANLLQKIEAILDSYNIPFTKNYQSLFQRITPWKI